MVTLSLVTRRKELNASSGLTLKHDENDLINRSRIYRKLFDLLIFIKEMLWEKVEVQFCIRK